MASKAKEETEREGEVHTSASGPGDSFSSSLPSLSLGRSVGWVGAWSPVLLHHMNSVKGVHFRSGGSKVQPFLTSPPTLLFAPQKLQVVPGMP